MEERESVRLNVDSGGRWNVDMKYVKDFTDICMEARTG